MNTSEKAGGISPAGERWGGREVGYSASLPRAGDVGEQNPAHVTSLSLRVAQP